MQQTSAHSKLVKPPLTARSPYLHVTIIITVYQIRATGDDTAGKKKIKPEENEADDNTTGFLRKDISDTKVP